MSTSTLQPKFTASEQDLLNESVGRSFSLLAQLRDLERKHLRQFGSDLSILNFTRFIDGHSGRFNRLEDAYEIFIKDSTNLIAEAAMPHTPYLPTTPYLCHCNVTTSPEAAAARALVGEYLDGMLIGQTAHFEPPIPAKVMAEIHALLTVRDGHEWQMTRYKAPARGWWHKHFGQLVTEDVVEIKRVR